MSHGIREALWVGKSVCRVFSMRGNKCVKIRGYLVLCLSANVKFTSTRIATTKIPVLIRNLPQVRVSEYSFQPYTVLIFVYILLLIAIVFIKFPLLECIQFHQNTLYSKKQMYDFRVVNPWSSLIFHIALRLLLLKKHKKFDVDTIARFCYSGNGNCYNYNIITIPGVKIVSIAHLS